MMLQRLVMLWFAYVGLVGLTALNWYRTEQVLTQIERRSCAIAALEVMATESLLVPETSDDEDLENGFAMILLELERLCGEI